MTNIEKLLNKLKNPSILFAILYSVFSIAVITVTVVLVCLGYNNVLMYILYGLSFVTLAYWIYVIVYYVPRIKNVITQELKKHKFTNELLESFGYRSVIFAICSFFINLAYAIFHAVIAILSRSVWMGALATYYIALTSIRGGLVAISRKRQKTEYQFDLEQQIKSYRNCGIYLVLLNFALVGAIVQMVLTNQAFKYVGILIYVMATYSFYKLGLSIYNLFKARKEKDYTIQSIKNISFADALVSILALQTAMIQAFGTGFNPYLPNSLTGGAVSIIIIAFGVYMIVKGNINLRKYKEDKKEKYNE